MSAFSDFDEKPRNLSFQTLGVTRSRQKTYFYPSSAHIFRFHSEQRIMLLSIPVMTPDKGIIEILTFDIEDTETYGLLYDQKQITEFAEVTKMNPISFCGTITSSRLQSIKLLFNRPDVVESIDSLFEFYEFVREQDVF